VTLVGLEEIICTEKKMFQIFDLIILFSITLIVSVLGILILIPILTSYKMFDRPNSRSSHTLPIPRGGGIAIILASLAIPFILKINWPIIVVYITLIFSFVSLRDDIKSINPFIRFAIHVFLVLIFFYFSPWKNQISFFTNPLPFHFDIIILFVALLWFINLFNFMDGIDGITGVECIILSLGATLVCFFNGQNINQPYIALAGAGVAFLIFNWHPAKIFLGDSGSIPLGFINGYILLDLSSKGLSYAALILSSYYLCDSSITLIKRILDKQKPWKAHNDHFYQKAVQKGLSHSLVSIMIALHGSILIILSILTEKYFPIWTGLIITAIWCLLFLYFLSNGFGKAKNV